MAERILVATANCGDTVDEKGERVDSSVSSFNIVNLYYFCSYHISQTSNVSTRNHSNGIIPSILFSTGFSLQKVMVLQETVYHRCSLCVDVVCIQIQRL